MKKYGATLIIISLIILLVLPRMIFPDSEEIDPTGLVNTIRFTAMALIISAVGIKLLFKE
ncbi:hypothetical protein IGI37_000713 [Enterococcus sp. AZ194]|uniref:hypothetical protein n=1 Tax=Enterococcus sp. AZ194 TaxID=2774629 RepID=UPI003F28D7E3